MLRVNPQKTKTQKIKIKRLKGESYTNIQKNYFGKKNTFQINYVLTLEGAK